MPIKIGSTLTRKKLCSLCHLSTHDVGWRLNISMHGSSGVRGGGAGDESTPPKLLIWRKPSNLWKCGQILWILWQNRCMCFDFTKVSAEIKVQTFLKVIFSYSSFRARQVKFGQVRGKFGQVWGECRQMWWLKCFDRKKCAQRERKCTRFLFCFWRSFSLEYFWARLRKFVHKSFEDAKISLLLHICMEQPPLLIQAQRMLEWSLTVGGHSPLNHAHVLHPCGTRFSDAARADCNWCGASVSTLTTSLALVFALLNTVLQYGGETAHKTHDDQPLQALYQLISDEMPLLSDSAGVRLPGHLKFFQRYFVVLRLWEILLHTYLNTS